MVCGARGAVTGVENGRVIDENIEPVKLGFNACRRGLDRLWTHEVQVDEASIEILCAKFYGGRFASSRIACAEQHDHATLPELASYAKTNTFIGASD